MKASCHSRNSLAAFSLHFMFTGQSIGVRAGGGEGDCSPPKFWAAQIFWAARENLGKASFKDVSMFFY